MIPFGKEIIASNTTSIESLDFKIIEAELSEHKLILLRGFESPTRDQFLSFCENIPSMNTLNWSFGPVMEMKENQDPQNYLFSREEVPFHWDGAFHQVPDYLVFHCVQAPTLNAGGETLFTNTELIIEQASSVEKEIWNTIELTYTTEKVAHYGGQIRGRLVQRHPRSKNQILRFAETVNTKLNPVTLDIHGVSQDSSGEILKRLIEKIYDPRFCYRHTWQSGDLLIADNHSLIHGRTAFQENCPRHLRRIQLLKELT